MIKLNNEGLIKVVNYLEDKYPGIKNDLTIKESSLNVNGIPVVLEALISEDEIKEPMPTDPTVDIKSIGDNKTEVNTNNIPAGNGKVDGNNIIGAGAAKKVAEINQKRQERQSTPIDGKNDVDNKVNNLEKAINGIAAKLK